MDDCVGRAVPGGGRQWNESAGKEKEKTGTGKRASKTRHGGTGGERRRTRSTGHPKAGGATRCEG